MDGKVEYKPEVLSSAKEKLQRSLQLKPDFHQALSTLVHIHYLPHEYYDTLARDEELIKVRKAGSYLEDMAEICALRGDLARAVELLKEAIGMNPLI